MSKNSTRATAVIGTTLALVIAGTAAVAAAGPRDRDDFRGFGGRGIESMRGMDDGWGMGGGFRGLDEDFERTERTVQTADGTTSVRVEQGVVDSASETGLSFTLGSGEAVSVVIDEDTQVAGYEEEEVTVRGWSRTRLSATEIDPAEIAAGAEVVVWSDSEDGADFIASRVVVKPTAIEDAGAAEDTETTDA
jgi:hypothetical protein